MEPIIQNLLAIQTMVRPGKKATAEQKAAIAELRAKVPAPILAHYDRLLASGRRGVALVHHGVCGGCHMKVPIGTAAAMAKPEDLFLCENCGCYLTLAPEEPAEAPRPPAPAPARKPRAKRVKVAV
jgi:predicted  nucleic acid-binding Zn-ribbon protein